MSVSDGKRGRTLTLIRKWCDLPQQTLELIAKHLLDQNNHKTNKINLLNFQHVWRESTTISSILPNPITLPYHAPAHTRFSPSPPLTSSVALTPSLGCSPPSLTLVTTTSATLLLESQFTTSPKTSISIGFALVSWPSNGFESIQSLNWYRSKRPLDWFKAPDLESDVLFLTRDHGFFGSHCYASISNCIVFSPYAFPKYITNGWEFREGGRKFTSVHRLTCGVAKWCHSYSSFVWSPLSSISHSDLLREIGKDEEEQSDSSTKEEDEEGKSDSSCKEEVEELQANSNSQERTAGTPVVDDASNVTEEEIPKDKVAHSTSGIPSAYEASEIRNTKTSFQGIDITSLLMPTLETIRAKHGNLIDEAVVRNKGMLACALELLASMVITLQNSTAKTLTDAVAEELRSNLVDLQYVGLKVDWLVPTVTKVLALQKSKPLIESIMSLEKAKAEVDEREREFLAESAKKKQELEESRADLFARIPLTEPIDLDECLGIGI